MFRAIEIKTTGGMRCVIRTEAITHVVQVSERVCSIYVNGACIDTCESVDSVLHRIEMAEDVEVTTVQTLSGETLSVPSEDEEMCLTCGEGLRPSKRYCSNCGDYEQVCLDKHCVECGATL